MIDGNLLKEILKDIEECEKAQESKIGSGKLAKSLIAKYSVLFPNFEENINTGGKISTGGEFDYRGELINIKEKLNGYLIKNSVDAKTKLKIKILEDIKKMEKYKEMSEEELKDLHEDIVNYYHNKIQGFGKNLYGYNYKDDFYIKDFIGKESIIANFKAIKSKLQAFYDADCENELQHRQEPLINATFSNQNANNINVDINIDIVYENAQNEIDNNTTFSDVEIEEIQNKLAELRETIASSESKRKKWDKAKVIFTFAMDKGIDVALAFLPMMNFLK